jgi:putative sugar O-methyltransferase
MPKYYGMDAISYLSSKQQQKDKSSSSYWDKYHTNFSFKDGKFSELPMIGSDGKKHVGFRKIAHYILQRPFRKAAKQFSSFNAVNKVAKNILSKQNKGYSIDVLRQVITVSYLNNIKPMKVGGTSCVIGDGFATMTSLLLKTYQQRVIMVNLSKTLLVDLYYLKLLLGDEFDTDVVLVTDEDGMADALSKSNNKPSVIAIEAVNHQLIQLSPTDLTINIASMQEMNPENIEQYFTDISIAAKKHSGLFYCCNREEKILPDGVVIKFEDYPWHLSAKTLDDGLCPWYQKYYSIKPPFFHSYDGDIRHRLVSFT